MDVALVIRNAIAGAIAILWAFFEAWGRVRHRDAQERTSRGRKTGRKLEMGKRVRARAKEWLLSTSLRRIAGLHGSVAMCLPVPVIENGEELKQRCDCRIIEQVEKGCSAGS